MMEAYLKPMLQKQREDLISQGLNSQQIDDILLTVKTQTQAQFLPELKRIVGEEMDKAVLKLKPQDSTSNSFKAGG
jgi:hypothetical protein